MSEDIGTRESLLVAEDNGDGRMVTTTKPDASDLEKSEYKTYRQRWSILGLFVVYSASNSMQWIQYSIIADVITNFYGVSSTAVDWTSMIYMVLYIPFVFPASYILDKLGLRKSVIIGSIGTCVGTWIKMGSLGPDLFWVTFLGQSIVALSQIFILSVPPKLAAVWFDSNQVSSACSIGVFGNQLGCAIGFVMPPLMVQQGTPEQIKSQLFAMFLACGIITTVILIAVVLVFQDKPPSPPSKAQGYVENAKEQESFLLSMKRLFTNRNYILLLLAYGINVGIFYAISTLLNQIVLTYYEDAATDAGIIGLLIVLAGMLGSVVCGVVLDKYRRYKETTLVVYIFSLIGMVAYTFTLPLSIIVVYCVSAFLGFFMTGLLPVGFELAAELTYPEPEGSSAGLLNAASQLFGIIFTSTYGVIFNNFGDKWANSVMCITLLIGAALVALIKSDLRRQAAAGSSPEQP